VASLLAAEALTKIFGGLTAVNEVSLTVDEGSIDAVIGPNGAGKTTLFNILAGSEKPTAGRVVFDGDEITGLAEHRIVQRGLCRTFQQTALFPSMSVLENVMTGAACRLHIDALRIILGTPRARLEEKEARETAHSLLEFVGIARLKNRLARELSYGDARRAAIARAMASSPRLLMLDEPAAGMNSAETIKLMELIRAVNGRGITVLVIEHNIDLVMNLASKITVLDHGARIASGSPSEIRVNPQVVEAYLGTGDSRAARRDRRLRQR
jgi:branched-chain amino acid transport system ATP-binding protein